MAKKSQNQTPQSYHHKKSFHLEFKNSNQKIAWSAFEQNDILFMIGPAGVGKSYLAAAFAISEILSKNKKKIILTRPIIEAGESLGFLPGTFEEKVNPYMTPLYDSIDKILGPFGPEREKVDQCIEIAPIAYLRGRTLDNAVCILDEAQNCTRIQLKLFLTRLGENSKMIITADPKQSDLKGEVQLTEILTKIKTIPGIATIEFKESSIVRHPLVAKILERLE
jgi:phosphate starvation-inducible PhoH-like protein